MELLSEIYHHGCCIIGGGYVNIRLTCIWFGLDNIIFISLLVLLFYIFCWCFCSYEQAVYRIINCRISTASKLHKSMRNKTSYLVHYMSTWYMIMEWRTLVILFYITLDYTCVITVRSGLLFSFFYFFASNTKTEVQNVNAEIYSHM